MGIRSFLGFSSSSSAGQSGSGSSGTVTRTGSSASGGWHSSTSQTHSVAREVHPAPAAVDRFGRRVPTPDPSRQPGAETFVQRNFGRPYSDGDQ